MKRNDVIHTGSQSPWSSDTRPLTKVPGKGLIAQSQRGSPKIPNLLINNDRMPRFRESSKKVWRPFLPRARIAFKAGITDAVYKDRSELLWAIVEIMKSDLAQLASEDVSYIQIDAPRYSYYMDPKWREWIRTEMKVDPDAALDEAVKADNACFRAARRCRNNSPRGRG